VLNKRMKQLLLDEVCKMSEMHKTGDTEWYMPADKFEGEYRQIVSTFNDIVGLHVASLSKVVGVVGSYGEGDFSRVLEELPGKGKAINDKVSLLRGNVLNLIGDAQMLSKAAVEGKLATRADATKHQGDFRTIVEGMNDTLDAVIGPLNVAAEYIEGRYPAQDH
jgi:methyl-accepting chemotaxis protein